MNIELTKAAAMILIDLRTFSASRLVYARRSSAAWLYRTHGSNASTYYTRMEDDEFDRLLEWKLIRKHPDTFRGDALYVLTDLGKSLVIPPVELLSGEPQP